MILLLDNYDSFTYNIAQSLERLGTEEIKTIRSKEITIEEIERLNPSHLIIGPGPGTPDTAGISLEAIKYFAGKIPILGICLGHQAIGQAFGSKIVQAKMIKHGVVEEMNLDGRGLFRIIGKTGTFTRYHSLVIDKDTLSSDFEITALAKDGDIMGIRHKSLFIEGIQFHPESIASKSGDDIFRAFLNYRRENLPVSAFLNQLLEKKDLSEEQAALFMENLTDGTLDERVTSAILTAIAAKGPSSTELAGCASVLCAKKTPLNINGGTLQKLLEPAETEKEASTFPHCLQLFVQVAANQWQNTGTELFPANPERRTFTKTLESKLTTHRKKQLN